MSLTSKNPTLRPRDPGDDIPYGVDWTNDLTDLGETGITASVWSASTPAGLTKGDTLISGMKTSVRVTGGVAGTTYSLTNTITTTPTGLTLQRTINIPTKEL